MKKKIIVIAILGLSSCLGNKHESDFNLLCELATKYNKIDQEPALKATNFAEEFIKNSKSDEVMKMFEAMTSASPEEKYNMILDTAHYLKVENWSCPALKEYYK